MTAPTPLTAYQQTYHWRNKNCGPWAHEWIKSNLPGVKVGDGSQSAEITEVSSVSGDCDLGQRKGKLLTIYDLEVEMKWEGKDKGGEEVKGSLKVPEVSHEAIDGLSDYVFEFSLTSPETSSSSSLLSYLRSSFPSVLKDKFDSFRPALIAAHGAGIDLTPSAPGSGTATPTTSNYAPTPPTKAPGSQTPKKEESKSKVGTTASVEVKADLQASADDLWGLLTDQAKIPMWSRAAAKMSLNPGSPFELFGGNVIGKTISAEPPRKLVQSWQARSPHWPSDHFGTMTISLNQGSDSTNVTFTLEGVPSGREVDTQQALESFYIRGLKQMGLVISSTSRTFQTSKPTRLAKSPLSKSHTAASASRDSKRRKPHSSSSSSSIFTPQLMGGAAVVLLCGVFGAIVFSSFK